jgi:hypothetical protein
MSNGAQQQQQPARTSRPQKWGGNNTKNTQTFLSFVLFFLSLFLVDLVGGDFFLFFMEGSYPSHWNTDLYQWAPQAL